MTNGTQFSTLHPIQHYILWQKGKGFDRTLRGRLIKKKYGNIINIINENVLEHFNNSIISSKNKEIKIRKWRLYMV